MAQNAFTKIIMQCYYSVLPVWQRTMSCYENHNVHTSVNDWIQRCCFAWGL